MKRCNHPLCALIADAASQTCWLEAQDVPDPVKLLRAVVDNHNSVIDEAVMVEVLRFLRRFEEDAAPIISAEGEPDEVTDVVDVTALMEAWSHSDEGVV